MRVLALLAFAVVGAAAGKGDPRRKFTYDANDSSLKITASSKSKDDKSAFKWDVSAGSDGLKTTMQYFSKSDDATNKFFLHQRFSKIVQYTPASPGAAFEFPADGKFKDAPYDIGSWSKAVYSADKPDEPRTATFSTTDGLLTVVLKIDTTGLTADGVFNVEPNDIKVDVTLDKSKFPGLVEGNELAILGGFNAATKPTKKKQIDDTNKDNMVDAGGAYYQWLTYVTCGTTTKTKKAVKSSSLADDATTEKGFQRVAWSFITEKEAGPCVWDPVMGASISGSSAVQASVFAALLSVFVALVAQQ